MTFDSFRLGSTFDYVVEFRDRKHIVKCSVHLADISEFDRFNRVYSQFFEGCTLPARTTVGSQLPDIKIEIDAVAYIPTATKELC